MGNPGLTETELERAVIERKGLVGERIDELFIYWFGHHEKSHNIDWIFLFCGGSKQFRATISGV